MSHIEGKMIPVDDILEILFQKNMKLYGTWLRPANRPNMRTVYKVQIPLGRTTIEQIVFL